MKTVSRQDGYVSGMLISVIALGVLLVIALGFGVWAFLGRQDYKGNSDQKVAAGQAETKKATEAADAIKYAEEAKNPLKSYVSPSPFGSVTVLYPKTWSGYVVEQGTDKSVPVDAYFHPNIVPSTAATESSFALRVQISQQAYDKALNGHASAIKAGKAAAQPYALPKVPGVVGTRIDGELANKKTGTLIILPLRNVTLQIWTEADQYKADFNNIILANLSFSP